MTPKNGASWRGTTLGAKAVFGPGTNIAEAAADLLAKLNAALGYAREAAE